MANIKNSFRELVRYPSAVVGLAIIAALIVVAAYAMIKIPYSQAIQFWRGGEEVWYKNPKFAPPAWFNLFTARKLPVSFSANTMDGTMSKTVTPGAQGTG